MFDGGGDIETWEGVARAVHDATGAGAPVSAFVLAVACQLELVPRLGGTASLIGAELRYNCQARHTRQHGLIAHEVAHWALRWCGEDSGEQAARFTAGALMLPRAAFARDLDQTWELGELQRRHPNVSAEMIARRLVELRDACVTIYDAGKMRARIVSPWLTHSHGEITSVEADLARAVYEAGALQWINDRCYAVPMFDGAFRRVVVVRAAA